MASGINECGDHVSPRGDVYRRYLDIWSASAGGAVVHVHPDAAEIDVAVAALAVEDARTETLRTCAGVNALLAHATRAPSVPVI